MFFNLLIFLIMIFINFILKLQLSLFVQAAKVTKFKYILLKPLRISHICPNLRLLRNHRGYRVHTRAKTPHRALIKELLLCPGNSWIFKKTKGKHSVFPAFSSCHCRFPEINTKKKHTHTLIQGTFPLLSIPFV